MRGDKGGEEAEEGEEAAEAEEAEEGEHECGEEPQRRAKHGQEQSCEQPDLGSGAGRIPHDEGPQG